MSASQFPELSLLLEALCEERISPEELARLETLVLADPAATRFYVEYIQLHGTLLWDTAKGGVPVSAGAEVATAPRPGGIAGAPRGAATRLQTRRGWRPLAAAALLLVAAAGTAAWQHWGEQPAANVALNAPEVKPAEVEDSSTEPSPEKTRTFPTAGVATNPANDGHARGPQPASQAPAAGTSVAVNPPAPQPAVPAVEEGPLVEFINAQLQAGWEAAGVQASGRAEDSEWLRRTHLDLVGSIPSSERVERFLKDKSPRKRAALVDELLDDPRYVRHWTTVWTNLLIGRSTSRDAQRTGLQKFLRESFAHNRPWKDVVVDLVSAEGPASENGAAGFLLAHLNNEAVPATAITARVLLGTQVQCTQCHNHPFNDWKQNQFWELNSFFQQTARVDRDIRDPKTGKKERQAVLVNKELGGPTFYEARSGLMRAAFPKFEGEPIDAAPQVNRRAELSRLIVDDDQSQFARAFVNRMWEHFFGAAFTRPVDDMGPHNPPTHPAVLERLTADFIRSGYDVKQLMRWICQTEAYQLSSRIGEGNDIDDPAIGNQPLFSRVYVKQMTAEQLYDSLLIATRAEAAPRVLKLDLDRQRDEWIQQFVVEYATEENDEATTFDGTIPQALLMMNSELVSAAVSRNPGTLLHDVLEDRGSEADKIRRLSLAALSRNPTPKEVAALRKALRDRISRAARNQNRDMLLAEGYQDVFWALLNSNEFVLVH